MALLKHCLKCKKETLHNYHQGCLMCNEKREAIEEAEWFSKTTDEKLLDLHQRLLKLEAGPIRF